MVKNNLNNNTWEIYQAKSVARIHEYSVDFCWCIIQTNMYHNDWLHTSVLKIKIKIIALKKRTSVLKK